LSELKGADKAHYVGRMFARIVPRYDLMNKVMTGGMDRRWRKETARLAAPPTGGWALDIAAGTGDLALSLAAGPAKPDVVALDFCVEMLGVARQKAMKRGVGTEVGFVCGDALQLPFDDDTFHCATMGFAMRNVADIPQALREVQRVLRSGGRFAHLELTPPSPGLRAALFWTYFRRAMPVLGGMVSGDKEAYRYLSQSLVRFPPAPALTAMMREAGFRQVSYRLLGMGTIAIHLAIK
jgi:demethylmenaquinone methyltransferase/2-methoxy-6-polyprenyl-1,4-benzoquinol methylase